MKQTLEIVKAGGRTNRVTISPTRVTVKTVADISAVRRKQLMAFVNYLVDQFVVIDKTWRGAIKFERGPVLFVRTSLSAGDKTPNRRFEAVV